MLFWYKIFVPQEYTKELTNKRAQNIYACRFYCYLFCQNNLLSPSSSKKLQISITFSSYFGNRTGSSGFGSESAAERIDGVLDYGQAL